MGFGHNIAVNRSAKELWAPVRADGTGVGKLFGNVRAFVGYIEQPARLPLTN